MRMRAAAVLTGATLTIGAAGVGLVLFEGDGGGRADGQEPTTYTVVALAPHDVVRLVVEDGTGRAVFDRPATGGWRAEPPGSPDGPAVLAAAEAELLPLVAFRRLAVGSDEPEFGLQPPQLFVHLEDHAGTSHRIDIGSPTVTGGGFYARRKGDDHLYVVTRRVVDDLRTLLGQATAPNPDEGIYRQLIAGSSGGDDAGAENPWLRQAEEEEGPR